MYRMPNVPSQLFTLSAVVVGFLLVDDATPNEQNALGNWLMLVSQYLCTSAVYGQLKQSRNQPSISSTPGSFRENNTQNEPTNEETIEMLKKMVNAINKEIEEIKKNINN